MTVQHSSLTDPELHEPKGAATASNGSVYVSDGAGSGAWTALSALTDPLLPEPKDISTATAGQIYIADGGGSGSWQDFTAAFTESFASGTEVITSGGQTILPHGLSAEPFDWCVQLQCITPEHGYAAGEIVKPDQSQAGPAGVGKGVSISADSTNLDIRYGSDGNVFNILNKSTGAEVEATNGNWRAIFKAWR